MRHYFIYLIEDDVARTFFGREDKLYSLFSEARITCQPHYKQQLERQIQYITKIIPMFYFDKKLYEHLKFQNGYTMVENVHMLDGIRQKSHAELHIKDQFIFMMSTGAYEAETQFFEALRDINPHFLAIDFEHERYGWLKPIKIHILSKNQLV